ncbi:S-adenosylmethionine:diacylglycerol 3-amino-3-carboxypropyl transferase, partial [Candidatus Magnetomorum sp. HK-1]
DTGDFFYIRFRKYCHTYPMKENFYISRLLLGKYINQSLPHYLRKENFIKLKSQIDRLKIITYSLEEFFDQFKNIRFSKANLSNIFEYMSQERTDIIFNKLSKYIQKNGIIAHWNLFVPRIFPDSLKDRLEIIPRKDKLLQMDKGWAYSDFYLTKVIS